MTTYDANSHLRNGVFPLLAYVNFLARWHDYWEERHVYLDEVEPFTVVESIARIEGRASWDSLFRDPEEELR